MWRCGGTYNEIEWTERLLTKVGELVTFLREELIMPMQEKFSLFTLLLPISLKVNLLDANGPQYGWTVVET